MYRFFLFLLAFSVPVAQANEFSKEKKAYEALINDLIVLSEKEQIEACETFLYEHPDNPRIPDVLYYLAYVKDALERNETVNCFPEDCRFAYQQTKHPRVLSLRDVTPWEQVKPPPRHDMVLVWELVPILPLVHLWGFPL